MAWVSKEGTPHSCLPSDDEVLSAGAGRGSQWECDDCGCRFVLADFDAAGETVTPSWRPELARATTPEDFDA